MGFLWNVISPLVQILIYSVVFTQLMEVKMSYVNVNFAFPIYLCSGLLPWIAFSECMQRGTNAFIENSAYLKKLPIPEVLFVAKVALSAFYSLIISMVLLFLFAIVTGNFPYWSWFIVLFYLLLLMIFAFSISLILASLNVFFRDIGQMLNIVLQAWMWATPIVYIIDILPEYLKPMVQFNPIYYFISPIRKSVLEGSAATIGEWGIMIAFSIASLVLASKVIKKLQPEIRDVI
jgi:lipopolysaccharide transport system permease protein